jgi:threonine dehydrogenase-like Zn-dependent dehydrogenase
MFSSRPSRRCDPVAWSQCPASTGPVSVNMGSIVQKGLRLCSGQTHVKRYLEPLTKLIQEKKVDTTFLITHRSTDLTDGPDLYQTFKTKKDGCVKVVFHPAG